MGWAYSQNRQVNIQTETSEQVTGSHTTLGVIWTWCGTLSWGQYPALDPSSFLLGPERPIDPLSGEPYVSSIRIIPGGIGFPLLPCSWEPYSCPFLILSALTSQWQWTRLADKSFFVPCLWQEVEEIELGIEEK